MELFRPLTGFYTAVADDLRISTTHISLYMALLQQWNVSGGRNPFSLNREDIMKMAKINARHTYNKCLNHLQEYGHYKIPAVFKFIYRSIVI